MALSPASQKMRLSETPICFWISKMAVPSVWRQSTVPSWTAISAGTAEGPAIATTSSGGFYGEGEAVARRSILGRLIGIRLFAAARPG